MIEEWCNTKNKNFDENHMYGLTIEQWDLLPEDKQDEYFVSDGDYWKFLFDFGRNLYKKGDKEVSALWKRNYDAYISSPVWKKRIEEIKNKRGNKCQICGDKNDLHVHHNTYDRLGSEDDNDLVVLCRKHHSDFHGVE